MVISNCLFLPTSENPRGFLVWYLLAELSARPPAFGRQAQLLIAKTVELLIE